MISINCKSCQKRYRVPDDAVGKTAKCGSCGAIMNIAPPPLTIDHWEAQERGRFSLTQAGFALKHSKIRSYWSGKEGRWNKDFQIKRPWHLLWAVHGGYMSSFRITIYEKKSRDKLSRPVDEYQLDGIKEGSKDIRHSGSLSFEVAARGPDPIRWLIVIQDIPF